MGSGTEVLSPGLISPSGCITAAKFRRFTRNYHQQPSAPGLSEQVNDLSPGLCPRVTTIMAGSASSQRSLPPARMHTRFIQPPTPKSHTGPQHTHPTGSVPLDSTGAAPLEGTATATPSHSDHPSVGYWENTEHSAATSPGSGKEAEDSLEQTAQMSRAARQAPAAAAQDSCPVSKAIPEPRVQGVPGCLQARQQPQQNPSRLVYLEGYFKSLLK